MKLIIQILVAALIVVATARAGESAWRYYALRDAVEQEARFGEAKSTSELHRRVLELADEHGVALAPEDVTVASADGATTVSVSYVEPIALVPAIYTRQQHYEFEISVRTARPLIVDDNR